MNAPSSPDLAQEAHRVDGDLRVRGRERLLAVGGSHVRVRWATAPAHVRACGLVVNDVTLKDEGAEVAANGRRGDAELVREGRGRDGARGHDEAEHAIFGGVCGHVSSP